MGKVVKETVILMAIMIKLLLTDNSGCVAEPRLTLNNLCMCIIEDFTLLALVIGFSCNLHLYWLNLQILIWSNQCCQGDILSGVRVEYKGIIEECEGRHWTCVWNYRWD